MAIVEQTTPLVYTGDTVRFPPVAPTEQLAQFDAPPAYAVPDAAPYAVAVLLCVAVALIFGALYLVARVDSQAFAVLAAFVVAGFVKLAFGVTR